MKIPWLLLFIAAGFPFTLQGADVSPFTNFRGNFSKNATVKVFTGQAGNPSGKIQQKFRRSKTGESGRLEINGTLELNGATRAFSVLYIFRRPSPEGVLTAAITNLAPGLDDGYSADKGTYTVTARTIRAEIPFAVGTLTGKTNIVIRLEKTRRSSRLNITHTLVTDSLTHPVVWRFRGLKSR